MNPQVLIVGAGPTGLTMALELARHGVACRIIEKAPVPSDKSRALGIQARTLELFEKMGFADQFTARGVHGRAFNIFYKGHRLVHLPFDGLDSHYPYLLLLQQSETEHILTRRLEKLGVQVERSVELVDFTHDAAGVNATLQHAGRAEPEKLSVPWLIGCDGAHSLVRQRLGLTFVGETMTTRFILADFHLDGDLPRDEVCGFSSPEGAAVFFPLPDQWIRLVANNPPAGIEGDRLPTLEDCQGIVDRRGPGGLRLRDPAWLANFRVNSRLASALRQGRVFVMGDSAHIHSPAGAQGMNTGIQDAVNLGWKLGLVLKAAAPESLLDTYEAERYPVEQDVLRLTDRMLNVGLAPHFWLRLVRNFFAPLVMRLPVVRRLFTRRIAQLTINYRKSSIVEDHLPRRGPRAGDRAPDANGVFLPLGTTTRLQQVLTGTQHWLLLFAGTDPSSETLRTLDSIRRRVEERHGRWISSLPILTDSAQAEAFPNIPALLDRDQSIRRAYPTSIPHLCLIRPDSYIAFRSPIDDQGAALSAYLNKLLL